MDLNAVNVTSMERLRTLLSTPINIHSPSAAANMLPEASVVPATFLEDFITRLKSRGVDVLHCNLEGSAAAVGICPELKGDYNDLDLVIYLSPTASTDDLHIVREAMLASVGAILPKAIHEHAYLYLLNMFLKSSDQGDSWALFTLGACEYNTPSLDIKCVQRCSRGYQFSVDSLFVRLDPLFPLLRQESAVLTPVESVAGARCGSFKQAVADLRGRLISCEDPSDMASVHGGGLLKYAALLSRGYRVAPDVQTAKLEKFMCVRYHIDFPPHAVSRYGTPLQIQRVFDYISTHMRGQPARVNSFVRTLRSVIQRAWPHDPTMMTNMLGQLLPRRPLSQLPTPRAPHPSRGQVVVQ